MSRTRIVRLLSDKRALSPAQFDEIALILVKVSQLVCDIAEIKEVEINRLLMDASGVVAMKARVRVAGSGHPAPRRLSIRPYPKELEDVITLASGTVLQLRPIRPEDEPGILELFKNLSPEERRMRFQHAMQELTHYQAAWMTQIDYDREMALVLVGPGSDNEGPEIYGVVEISADPDNERAEYAILVRKEVAGQGLGRRLLQRMINYTRNCGIKEIFGQVLAENAPMLRVCSALGFVSRQSPDDPGTLIVSLKLDERENPTRAHTGR
jgi:acetyltransferase